jgi:hypothetical protein
MDLSTIKPSERILEIVHPSTGEPIGVRVTAISITDPSLKQAKKRILDRRLSLEQKGKGFKADDIESNLSELLFASLTGWDWYGKDVSFHGEKPQFNKVNVTKVFQELEWFQTQVYDFVNETSAFYA